MYAGDAGLGFSLKPPKWLRDLGAQVLSSTRVVVPTPLGPITVDPTNPAELERLRSMLSQTRVTLGPQEPTPLDRAASMFQAVPGGAVTLLGVGAALLFLLSRRR